MGAHTHVKKCISEETATFVLEAEANSAVRCASGEPGGHKLTKNPKRPTEEKREERKEKREERREKSEERREKREEYGMHGRLLGSESAQRLVAVAIWRCPMDKAAGDSGTKLLVIQGQSRWRFRDKAT